MQRRTFLLGLASVGVGGGLVLGWAGQPPDLTGDPAAFGRILGETTLNGWVRVAADGSVTVAVPRADLGQGATTTLAALVAEEMDLDWRHVRVEMPPQARLYANTTMLVDGTALLPEAGSGGMADFVRQLAANGMRLPGMVATGGSTSIRDGWLPMRSAGAAARQLLLQAAAAHWQVEPASCHTEEGRVLHAVSGRSLGYGEVAPAAARLSLAAQPVLRTRKDWRLLGHDLPRLDIPGKVNGHAAYGLDAQPAGLVFAAVRMAPHAGGEVQRVNPDHTLGLPGILAVVTVPGGIAVVADQWWRAQQALGGLDVSFTVPAQRADSAALRARYRALAADAGATAHVHRKVGDQAEARTAAGHQVVESDVELPFLAHAALEPVNCTARLADGQCEVWAGHQMPTVLRWVAAKAAGISADQVTFHAAPLGGSFGRRLELDMVVQAVTVAARLPGKAVKLVWTRTTDLCSDVYRPMALVRQRVALDAQGLPLAWHIRVVTPSIVQSVLQRLLPVVASDLSPDKTAVDGAAELPYAVPALRVEHVLAPAGLPVGFWRSVGHSINAFAVESMVNELASKAGQDPLAYRLRLLAAQPRHLAVLRLAASEAGWDRPLPAGAGRGLAVHACFGSVIAVVVDVAQVPAGFRVTRITAAVDCGQALHPDNVRAQIEGGLLFGLGAALRGEVSVTDGQVRLHNFDDYPCLRMDETPPVTVRLVETPEMAPGGIGEVGVPAVAPALAAAVHGLRAGEPLRRLPLQSTPI